MARARAAAAYRVRWPETWPPRCAPNGGQSASARKSAWNPGRARVFDRAVFWPVGQLLNGQRRVVAALTATSIKTLAASLVAAALFGALACSSPSKPASSGALRTGGALVATVRSNPTTFNRIAGTQQRTDDLFGLLTTGKLVRINRATQELEPWLAESWTRSDDAMRYTLKLRPNVVFSDGHPFTADDVLFSFAAVYDDKTGSPLKEALQVGRKNLQVASPDPGTIVVTFPSPFGPGLRALDNLPILPRHKLG